MLSSRSDAPNVCRGPVWKTFINTWGPAIFWAGVIFLFSTDQFSSSHTLAFMDPLLSAFFPGITPEQFETIDFVIRKSAHLTEYFIFSLLLIRAVSGGLRRKVDWGRAVWILAAVVLYALSDEFHQVFVPSRTPSLADVGIDWFAGFCGILWTYLSPKGKGFATDAAPDNCAGPQECKKP